MKKYRNCDSHRNLHHFFSPRKTTTTAVPATGNVRQRVHFEYACPCLSTASYYERELTSLAARLKDEADCVNRQPKLGLCRDTKSKLSLECRREETLEVVVTVSAGREMREKNAAAKTWSRARVGNEASWP